MPCCCAINCKNSSKSVRLFRLPTGEKNIKRREVWLKNIGRKKWNPDVAYICENHFTSEDFEQNRADGRKLLKWNAVPTLFPSRITKIKSRFVRNAKIPETNCNDIINSYNIELVVKQESCNQDSSTLILPESVTAPINGDEENKKIVNDRIIYVKYEPKKDELLNSSNKENDKILKEDILYLKRKIRFVNNKIKNLESIKKNFHNNLRLIYNEDQTQYLEKHSGEDIVWSDETLEKALNLFKACGIEGYREIINQNLPFPSLDLLFKFHPDIKEND